MRRSGLASPSQRLEQKEHAFGSGTIDAGDARRAHDSLAYARSCGYIAYIRDAAPEVVELVDPVGAAPGTFLRFLPRRRVLRQGLR